MPSPPPSPPLSPIDLRGVGTQAANTDEDGGAGVGAAVGGAVGGLVVLAIIIGLAVYIYMLKKKTTGNTSNNANNSSTTAVATPMVVAVEIGAGPVVGVAKKIPISLKLEELGCGQYEAALADQGWDSLASMQGLTKEEAGAIADEVKMKPGHKRRFVDGFAVR